MAVPAEDTQRMLSMDGRELPMTDEEGWVVPSRSNFQFRRHHLFSVVGGISALAACTLLGLAATGRQSMSTNVAAPTEPAAPAAPASPVYTATRVSASAGPLTARSLLEDPDVIDVATGNLMRLGHKALRPEDESGVRSLVAQKFYNVSAALKARSPEFVKELETIRLTQAHKGAVLRMLKAISDPQVQRAGLLVAHAIRDSESKDESSLQHAVLTKLSQHTTLVQGLMHKMLPTPLRSLFSPGTTWKATSSSHDVGFMATFDDKWDMELSASKPEQNQDGERRLQFWNFFSSTSTAAPSFWNPGTVAGTGPGTTMKPGLQTTLVRLFGILGGAAEEASFLVEVITFMSRLFGKSMVIPTYVPTVTGGVAFGSQFASCEMAKVQQNQALQGLVSCPLALGTTAFRFLHLLTRVMGVDQGYGASGLAPQGVGSTGSSLHKNFGVWN